MFTVTTTAGRPVQVRRLEDTIELTTVDGEGWTLDLSEAESLRHALAQLLKR